MRHRFFPVTFAVGLIWLPQQTVGQTGGQPYGVTYGAASGQLPTEVCPPWTEFDSASPEDPSLSGGVLTLSTSSNGANIFYVHSVPDVAVPVPDPMIVEVRVKVVSGSTSHHARAPIVIAAATAPSVGTGLQIGQDEIFLLAADLVRGQTASVQTDDAFHTYRLEVSASTGQVKVFYDGVLTLTGSTFFDFNTHGTSPRVLWGEGSSFAFGTSEWLSVSHNAGVANPSCAPASLTLDPPAAMNPVSTNHCVTATVQDLDGDPTANIVVRFSVSGSTVAAGSATTGASGQASFCYVGPALPGGDMITAFADTDTDATRDPNEPLGTAAKTWVAPSSTPGKVTGGGKIQRATGGTPVTFGVSAQNTDEGLKGTCNIVDHALDVKIKCVSVTSLIVSGTHATIFGAATQNGVPTSFRIDADDLAESGSDLDSFAIATTSGYAAGGLLTQGNIQVQQ